MFIVVRCHFKVLFDLRMRVKTIRLEGEEEEEEEDKSTRKINV